MKLIAAFLSLLCSFALVQSLAQTPAPKSPQPTQPEQQDDDVISIKSNLVQVDAVVLDAQGRQVTNLSATDFEIVEDGKLRTPEHFSYISVGRSVKDSASAGSSNQQPGRVFVFVVSNPIVEFAYSFAARGSGGPPQVITERMAKLIEKANRAQVAIYTVQARDLSPRGGNSGNDGLIHLAQETGGRAIYNTNDLRVGFEQVVEESRGYYLLAYNPGPDALARPHRLQVRVKHSGLKVLTRAEAYSRGAGAGNRKAIAHPLESPVASREIEMSIKPSLVSNGRISHLQLSWRIDLSQVETKSQPDNSLGYSLDLSIRVTGPDGRLLKQTDKNTTFEVGQTELSIVRREGLVSRFEFETATPGHYRISVAARDTNSGKLGRLTRFVEIGKNGTLISSGEASK